MKYRMDYTGFRNGRIVVLKVTDERCYKKKVWLCQCDCGNLTYITTSNLVKTKSCGCLRDELLKKNRRPRSAKS